MRKFYVKSLIVVGLLVFFGCSSETEYSDNISETSLFKVNKVLEMNIMSEKRLAYSLLDENEKMFIWKSKFDALLDGGSLYGVDLQLNSEQQKLLVELQANLNIDFFDDKQNDKKEYLRNIYVPEFIGKAKQVFPDNLIGLIFYEISVPVSDTYKSKKGDVVVVEDLVKALSVVDENSDVIDCNCDRNAFFSCSWGQNESCRETKCKIVQHDCGFAWAWECNGKCKVI